MKLNEHSFTAEIHGNEFCLLEGIKRISAYSDVLIETAASNGFVRIAGSDLKLIYYSEDRIGIRGCIRSLSFDELSLC